MINFTKCSKEKCNEKYEIVDNDKEIIEIKNKLIRSEDYKEIEKNLIDYYSNKYVKDLELCVLKKCKNINKIQKDKLNFIKKNVILYDIKLSTELNEKLDNLIKLSLKPSLNDDEYMSFLILLFLFEKIINNNILDYYMKLVELNGEYKRCSKKYCKKYDTDKELKEKLKIIANIKDDKKRNELIRKVYSNEKQIKLDKCITNKCNNYELNLIHELLKTFNNKIKFFNIKVPKEIQIPDIIELKEEDIPEIIIKINQLSYYLKKYI